MIKARFKIEPMKYDDFLRNINSSIKTISESEMMIESKNVIKWVIDNWNISPEIVDVIVNREIFQSL